MEETGVPGEKTPINHKSLTMSIAYNCLKYYRHAELKYIYIKKKKMTENKTEVFSK